jgi:hypothetical protein
MPNDLELTGLLVWLGRHGGEEWKEPLLAAIHFSTSSLSHLGYELRLGDTDRGFSKMPIQSPHDFPYVPVDNWLFTFVSSD